ncbi:MAG: M1 family aminopeptidase, partial [Chthonomonadales bacterium]
WDKFTIVETAQKGWPGALEAYSFTTYGPGIIPGDNPHEWGHTWWGGFVPNTYLRDIWNESLATYSESVYYRRAKGDAAANAILDRAFWVRPFPGMDRLVGAIPLSESFDALFGSAAVVGYQKGGLVMQNLEETLGYNLLQKCLKAFRTKFMYSGKAAVWADFEEIVNSVTGKDYTWFFNQWVRKAGLPKLALANVKSTSIGGSYEVEGDVTQSGSPYWLKMPIWIATAQGHVKTTVQVDGENTHFKISVPSTPTTVLLDPEIRVPRTLTNNDTPASARSGMDALIITSQSGMDQANKQKRGERTLVLDTKVKDADLKGHDLVIVGNVETNKIWRRLAKSAPFTATATSVAFEGKTYPGASASGSITSPFDGEYRVFFITETGHSTIPSGLGTVSNPLSVSIFDKGGNLLAGRLALPTKGSGVFQLK